ncbi:MAG: nucleoside hydrolase [Terriglobia bacterium]
MKRVIMDVDTGVDDALALVLALRSPELHLEAITTVAGNTSVEAATRNTRLVLDVAQAPAELPVAQGAARPLARELVTAEAVHGADGLGNVTSVYPTPKHPLASEDATTLLLSAIDRYGDELTVVATAPMTNLARAALRDPATFRRLGKIVQMGGAVRVPGNISKVAEYNLYLDPEAAAEVAATGVRLRLVPLDVTLQAKLLRSDLRRLALARDSAVFQFIREITVICMDAHQKFLGLDGMNLHDPMAVAAAIDPPLFTWQPVRLEVRTDETERGRTLATPEANSPVAVATAVAVDRFLSLFTERVCR